jgi:hypothetical protein
VRGLAKIATARVYQQATYAGATCTRVGCEEQAYFFAPGWHRSKLLAGPSKLQCSARHDEAFVQAALFSLDTGGQRLIVARGALDGPASSLLQCLPNVKKLARFLHPFSVTARARQLLDSQLQALCISVPQSPNI